MRQQMEFGQGATTRVSRACPPSKTIERRKTYSRFAGLLSAGCAAVALLLLPASCSRDNAAPRFETSGDAITACHEFLSDIQETESMEWEKLAASVASWQELRDSVSATLRRDTLHRAHDYPEETFRAVRSSIAAEYKRLALAKPRTYREVLYLKEYGTPAGRRKTLSEKSERSRPFFASLDTLPPYKDTPRKLLERYDRFLSATLEHGLAGKRQFLDFLRDEDVLFRSFLNHLPELAGTSMAGITDKTGKCCLLAVRSAGKPSFPVDEAVQYLAMRTNRRQLQNAVACMEDIKGGRLKSPEQAQACLWMLVQPFMDMDGDDIALLTLEQKKSLYGVADYMPTAIGRICAVLGQGKERLEALPELLLKIHLSTL